MRLTLVLTGYFKKFVEREIVKGSGAAVYNQNLGWKLKTKRKWIFDENRPWTDAAKETNMPGEQMMELVEPIAKEDWKIFRGDIVQILKGIDAGKQGVVCSIIRERNWCYVEGLNCVYKWFNRSATNPGVMSRVEKPLMMTTEVSLVDPSDTQPTAVEWRFDEDGNRVRVSMRTGRILPLSVKAENEGEDYIDKLSYKTQGCDTEEAELLKVTYQPSMKTFEQDIMDSMGIEEDRKRAPNYYY